ncbi:MAG: type IV pilus assembly protein PilM [Patescibacteria group bacterium]|nr:type IV pilus assembly protein PilM [Patescibacteria group bacterium]
MGTFFGLDIGSSSIKVLQAEKSSAGYKLKHFASGLISGRDQIEVIKQVIKESSIKQTAEVNVSLPESDVYTRIVTTPLLSSTELASSIQYEAEQYVPVALSEVELFHQVLSKSTENEADSNMKVLLIAVTKTRLNKLTSVLDAVGLIPKSLETELFSLKRVFTDISKTQLLISFGHRTTDMMILDKGVPMFLHSMSIGSMTMTNSLVSELKLPVDQAEQYKITYGVREDLLEGKVARVLLPLLDQVVNQVNKSFVYLKQQGMNKLPEQLVVTGGGALLPGLSSYLVKKVNVETIVGNPVLKFVKDETFNKFITKENSPELAVVAGLAIKGLD